MEILALTDGDRVVETQWLLMTSIGIPCEYVHNGSALIKTLFDIIRIICVFLLHSGMGDLKYPEVLFIRLSQTKIGEPQTKIGQTGIIV